MTLIKRYGVMIVVPEMASRVTYPIMKLNDNLLTLCNPFLPTNLQDYYRTATQADDITQFQGWF